MRWIFAVILVFLLQALCLGQSNESPGKELDYHSDFTEAAKPRQIKLEDYLTLSESRYTLRYEGLQGVLISRGTGLFRKYEREYLSNRWNSSNMNICEWDRWMTNYMDDCVEFQYGRWWDRSFFDSLVPERGGVVYKDVIVGKETAFLSWNNFHLMNTGRVRVAKWGFDVERVQLPSAGTVAVDPTSIVRQRDPPLSIRAIIPKGVLENEYFRVSTIQNITLRGTLTPENIIARIEVGVDVKFYSHYSTRPWAQLIVKCRASPFQDQYELTLHFELFCF